MISTTVANAARGLRVPGICVNYVPQLVRNGEGHVPHRVCALAFCAPTGRYDATFVRRVGAFADGKKWYFTNEGTPLRGEQVEDYQRRRVPERFSEQDLVRVVHEQCGFDCLDDSAYAGDAVLFEEDPPSPHRAVGFPVEEVRNALRAVWPVEA